MTKERFIHNSPLKDQILGLRRELAEIERELVHIEQDFISLERRMGCLFVLFQFLSFFTWPPRSNRLTELSNRQTYLKNRIKSLEEQSWNTTTPNQTKAFELDAGTSRGVVHELRAHHDLASFSSKEFEDVVALLFQRLGWEVTQTPYSNDGGKDAILRRDDQIVYLECKHYTSGTSVGRPHLQKLKGAMVDSNISAGIIVTSTDVSDPAKEYGEKHNITVMEGNELRELLITHKLLHLKKGIETYVLHCSNCLQPHQFTFSFRSEEKKCPCGNTVSNGMLIVFGTSKSPLPAFYA